MDTPKYLIINPYFKDLHFKQKNIITQMFELKVADLYKKVLFLKAATAQKK